MTLLLVFAGIPVFAQLCQGNFSEPVFAEDFGQRGNTGATYGPPLAPGETTYNYFAGPNVQDGSYTITDNPVNALSVFHSVQDRTPDDINGYMMVVNSDFDPGEFYRKRVTGLCENTLFEFSAWVLNVLPDNNNCGPNSILPNIRFEVRSTAGALIAFAETGNVQETVSPQWVQYGVAFTTDASTTEVDVVMINNAPGGCGNDLAIDDIEFRACGDVAEIASISGNGEFCDDAVPASLGLEANLSGNVYSSPVFQWQESTNGVTWTTIPGATNSTYTISPVVDGAIYRYQVAETVSNLANQNCGVNSDLFRIQISPTYFFDLDPEICDTDSYLLPDGSTVNTSGNYSFSFISQRGCDSSYNIDLTVHPSYEFLLDPVICADALPYILPDGSAVTESGTYELNYTTTENCDSNYRVNLIVNPTYLDTVRIGICDGLDYTLPDGSVIPAVTGFYPVTLPTLAGCDSTIVTRIRVDSIYLFEDEVAFCAGGSHMLRDGTTVTETGEYNVNYVSERGCDSIYRTQVTVHPTYDEPIVEIGLCDNETFTLPDGSIVADAGFYSTTLTTEFGCDSTLNFDVRLLPSFEQEQEVLICDGDSFVSPTGVVLTTPGMYRDTLSTVDGCDSIIITNLTIAELAFPTGFSPNGDGVNDVFKGIVPDGCTGFVSDFVLRIYNRWGEEIFLSTSLNTPWFGDAAPGIYLWSARFTYGETFNERSGLTTLVR